MMTTWSSRLSWYSEWDSVSGIVEAHTARTDNTWDQYVNKVKGLIGDFANKRKQVLVKTYNRENISGGTGLFGGWGGQSSGSVLGGGSSSSSGSGILLRLPTIKQKKQHLSWSHHNWYDHHPNDHQNVQEHLQPKHQDPPVIMHQTVPHLCCHFWLWNMMIYHMAGPVAGPVQGLWIELVIFTIWRGF